MVSKYRNVKVEVDNIVFDSKREALRYSELKMLLRCGTIKDLELQPVYELAVNGRRIGEYRADFRYKALDGKQAIEDSKGMRTPLYKWKKKHCEAQYNIRIIEV